MDAVTVIVFERASRWEAELQGQFIGQTVRVLACRSTGEIELLSTDGGDGVVVVDLRGAEAEVLRFLEQWEENWPVLVIGPAETGDLEWPLRELGARDVVLEPLSPSRLARLCLRAAAGIKQGQVDE